ncbi:MAG TPA: ATP-binding protein [Actinomycetota bacterium]|nr:ATP-binding protein [Actinomycetota bacterium]
MSSRSRSFRSGPEAAADARRFVRASLGRDLPPDRIDDAVLLTDELMTNSVRHAATREPIDLSITMREGVIRVAVSDAGRGFDPNDPTPPVGPPRDGGWGLELVDSLSDRWGVDRDGARTVVWFEMDASRSRGGTGFG